MNPLIILGNVPNSSYLQLTFLPDLAHTEFYGSLNLNSSWKFVDFQTILETRIKSDSVYGIS